MQLSADGGSLPRWSADGREFFYLAADGDTLMAAEVDGRSDAFSIGEVKALFSTSLRSIPGPTYDAAPDGRRFIVNTAGPPSEAPPITLVINVAAELKGRLEAEKRSDPAASAG